MLDLATLRELLTPSGQRALADAVALQPTESAFLGSFEKLRKQHPAPLAKAALEIALLRVRARAKFANADKLYFTREALEQSSGDAVANYRAKRLAPFGVVADLCCGVGGDALAFAANGLKVHAVELDPLRAAMAEANAAALGLADRVTVHVADAITAELPDVRAAFADPSRRSAGSRHLDPEDYTPPLSAIRGRFPQGFPLGVKIAPGVAHGDIAEIRGEAEFISVNGELKECVLWFGELQTANRRATTIVAGSLTPATLAGVGSQTPAAIAPVPVEEFLFDPDAAVVRAGLSGELAEQLGLSPLDWTVAMFTGPELVRSPFVTAYRVEFAAKFHIGKLRDHLRQHHVGRVTIVKRGSMIDAEEVQRRLKLYGPEHRMVILTRANGEQTMIVGSRVMSEKC